MLVLSRRVGESVVLPGLEITVRVLAVDGGRVRLGFDAPPAVVVMRSELVTLPAPPPSGPTPAVA